MRVCPNPPVSGTRFVRIILMAATLFSGLSPAQTLYDFGNPTGDEQLYIELINRARANPSAEGTRFATTTDPTVLQAYSQYAVNLGMMQTEFNALAALPPLAPNAKLTTIARSHSAWMLANAVQAHDETNPTKTLVNRLNDVGYPYSTAGENIFAYVKNVWHGHAGLDVDWGSGANGTTGGMQNPRGHRNNIHSTAFREIGVGVVYGTNGQVGPQLVTQDFGTQSSNPTLGTGVAYYDLNTNDFYDSGEGIAGLTVNVSGASYYCNTANGGGWTVPVPATTATRTVTFSGLNVNSNVNLMVTSSANAKADLKLSYSPPAITSAPSAVGGYPHTLTFSPVGGATGYTWTRSQLSPAAAENCESTSNVSSSTTGTYSVLNTSIKQQGAASFHLENSTGASQSIQLNPVFHAGASPSINFQSLIRYATTAEQFKVQIKEEGSLNWQDVYSQSGSGDSGESSFTLRTANLTSVTGKSFRVRFLLNFETGSYYQNYTGDAFGWFIDAISFSGVSILTGTITESLAGTSGAFNPAPNTSYLMSVYPVISARNFPGAYQTLAVSSGTLSPPEILSQPASVTIHSGTTATFSVTADGSSPSYQWYVGNSGATSNPVAGANGSSYTTPALSSTTTYWVRVSNGAGFVDSASATATVIIPPNITTQPVSQNIASGTSATFTVTASGSSPSYQWYVGTSGVTTNPIAGATSSSFTTPALYSTTNYWVRVFNAASSVNSNTVSATMVTPPVISNHPGSVTINSGSTTTLSVTASGSGLNYQWYSGASGVTSTPVPGATQSTFNTPALTATTNYWVRVSNIGGFANSNTATVTLVAPPAILSQPVSTTIPKGTTTTISVIASNATSYQWYAGDTGVTSSPISGANSSSYTTPTLNTAKKYWVRVTNTVGSVDSVTATINTQNGAVTRNFTTWASEIETANSIAAGTLSLANGDYDKDGRTNLIEYAFGASPIIANDPAPRLPARQASTTHYVIRYQVDTGITDIVIAAVASPNLQTWRAPGESGAPAGFTDTLISTSGTIQTREAKLPFAGADGNLMRMRVTRP